MQRALSFVAAATLLAFAADAHADDQPPSTDPPAKSVPGVVQIDDRGLTLRSLDDAYALRLRAVLQTDLRMFVNDEHKLTDQFVVRRARLYVEGRASRFITYRLMPDFGSGQVVLFDAWFDLRAADFLRLRIGKAKPPFGLERLVEDTALTFAERAYPTSLVPNRDLGVELHGDVFGPTLSYSVGVFNGAVDNGLSDGDFDDSKELGARLEVGPFATLSSPYLSKLRLGVATTRGEKTGTATNTYLGHYATFGQNTFFSYLADSTGNTPANTVVAAGLHARSTIHMYWPSGPLALLGELVETQERIAKNGQSRFVTDTGWNATASYVLTGEAAAFEGPTPRHGIDVSKGHFGALELAARMSEMHVGATAFPLLADPTKSARDALEWVLGVNWYPTAQLKMVLDFARTTFEGGAPGGGKRDAEQVFITRAQFAF